MQRAVFLTALFGLVALSGCSSGGSGGADDGLAAGLDDLDLQASDTTGILRGVVVDEAIKPLAGVNVTIRLIEANSVNQTTKTNGDGLFGFGDLAPGQYFLTAEMASYAVSQAGPFQVVAGVTDPTPVKVTLLVDRGAAPYASNVVYDAYLACSVTSPSVSAAVCGLGDVGEEFDIDNPTNNRFLVNYQADKPPSWVQVEAIWDSTQPLGGEVGLSITALGPPQVGVNDTAGKSPIYITVNETDSARFNYGINDTDISIRLFSSDLTGTDVVPEDVAHGAYGSNVYPTLESSGVSGAYGDAIANDPMCSEFGLCLLVNPFGNPECVQYPVLFNDCYRVGGAGLVINQRVTVFTQIFYGYTPPPGWRFSDGAGVPQPT